MSRLMIYGAAGYTGRMAAARAKAAGLDVVLAGRDEVPLRALATVLGVEYRVFPLDIVTDVERGLHGVTVLLNCAGPFVHTAAPLLAACLRTGTHYLDIAAELVSYELAAALDPDAVKAGVMLMPGSGGSVAMLGSLATRAMKQIERPRSLRIALHVTGAMSRGSATSASEQITAHCLMRRGGELVGRDPRELRDFDFGNGASSCFPVTLPDLITIARQSGVADIETYVHVSGIAFPDGGSEALPDGPTDQERAENRYHAAVEVMDADGSTAYAVLDTVNGYSFTPLAAIEAARRVLAGEVRAGFQTPVDIFGSGFAESIADTRITLQGARVATHSKES
ncbi:saccharopine dehydrogenase NADP-binding domain-containing protein [Stenotrophomonas maltophilia]|uniref:saccharopine dehydrogenase NADP-binding domain-containing protein n=1 Tax=Stenotrophomonas maltophilia TaxID=40324 RepID=UPI0039F679A9